MSVANRLWGAPLAAGRGLLGAMQAFAAAEAAE